MAATSKDVAERAAVSMMTVSRVFTPKPGTSISRETRDRVHSAARELGYRPNRVARALATGRTHAITLWTSTVFTPYFASAVTYTQQAIKQDGYSINIWDTDIFKESPPSKSVFPQAPADGILALEYPELVAAYRGAHPAHRAPIVSMGGSALREGDSVGVDLYSGTLEAIRHLVSIGCRRIAYLLPRHGAAAGDARYEAYQRGLQDSGLRPEMITQIDELRLRASAVSAVVDYVKRNGHPDGIFCYNDELAIGANRALHEMGLCVPEDVALVGCDGIEETEYQRPQLSTIVLPIEEMSRTAWRFLKNRIENPQITDQQVVLGTRLVIRGSSRRS